jgi:arabinosaccharide transport system substrate-binding protein
MEYPYGKAPFWILILAILSGAGVLAVNLQRKSQSYDLVFQLQAQEHYKAYLKVLPNFEKKFGVRVQMQQIESQAMRTRLQSSRLTGKTRIADVVELTSEMGYFTKGPLEDVVFVDLTDRVNKERLMERMVASRFSIWSSRGHIFALPHDVHPSVLVYRRDLVEQLGIDANQLTTWDKFVEAGRRVTKDLNGDGVIDRYMIDIPASGDWALKMINLQRGVSMFAEDGTLQMDRPEVAEDIVWMIRQTRGPERISFSCGWGQSLARAMDEGLCLFYFAPDWRTKTMQTDTSELSGKMGAIPFPAWEEGGCRTAVWGGTGIAITKRCKNPDLAWELIKFLYLNENDLAERYLDTNIIPPLRSAWKLPVFDRPNPYYSNQKLGIILSTLAAEAPADNVTAYSNLADTKVAEAFLDSAQYYEQHGEKGLEEFVVKKLAEKTAYVRNVVERNRFLYPKKSSADAAK